MKKLLLSGAAFAALAVSPALAADLRAPVYKAPPPVEYYNWTGFYIGTHSGVAVGDTRTNNVPTGAVAGFDAIGLRSYDLNPPGLFGGIQLGYNMQMSNWVVGLEADLGYLGVKQHTRPAPDDLVEVQYGWYATVTGRIGLAWDRMLSYVKGGGVVARIRNTASDLDGTGTIDASDFSEITRNRWGWVIGTGFEYAILPSWTLKSEFLYMDFGTQRSTNLDGDLFDHRNRLYTAKIGLNYRWGATSMR